MRCFQLMEAANTESLNAWTNRWNDLVEFEIVPVLTSQEFWARVHGRQKLSCLERWQGKSHEW